MKKLFTLVVILSLGTSSINAQAFSSGSSYISLGYGLGLGYRTYTAAYQSYSGYNFSGFGPVSGAYEYGINDNIGVGLNISYSSYGASWNQSYDYSYRFSSLGVLARGAYHFDIRSREADLYAGIGVGFLRYAYNWTSDEPGFNEALYDINLGTPLGYQIFAGARYYFSPSFGVMAELGYGISVLNAGIVISP